MFKVEAAKKAVRSAVIATSLLGFVVAPVAQAASAKPVQNVTSVRAGTATDKENELRGGGGGIVAVLAVIAIIGGILAATSGSSKPTSP